MVQFDIAPQDSWSEDQEDYDAGFIFQSVHSLAYLSTS